MNRLFVFFIAAACLPLVGVSQPDGGAERTHPDSASTRPRPQLFDTHPMPNAYQQGHAVAMPNAYRGDNCVAMPNAYQEKPTGFILKHTGKKHARQPTYRRAWQAAG